MDRKKKLYKDILNAIDLVDEFTADITSFDQYVADHKTKSAVERQLSIIGEVLTQLRKAGDEDLTHTHQIIGLRNLIIHSYDTIDDSIIWAILQKHLSPLKGEIVEILT